MKAIFLSLFILSCGFARAETCGQLIAEASAVNSQLYSYLNALLEGRVLMPSELTRMAEDIEAGRRIRNPLANAPESLRRIHARELDLYLNPSLMNQFELLAWIRQRIAALNEVQGERRQVAYEVLSRRMAFVRVEADEKDFHNFEIMDTPITQGMWTEIMGNNPAHFKDQASGDQPIEMVTWWSAIVFANRPSEKMGLRPAYDLSGLKFSGSAEDGDLATIQIRSREYLQMNAPDGETYRAEGFRLPGLAEISAVLRRTKIDDPDLNIDRYEWNLENSQSQTHGVAELLPRQGLPKKIFDLAGNVSEWLDFWRKIPEPRALHAMTTGSDWRSSGTNGGHSSFRYRLHSTPAWDVGFRLVRTVE